MSVFRTKSEPVAEEALPTGKESDFQSIVEVEPPYLSYQSERGHPYSVDYFGLGDLWNSPDGGFSEEIETIEDYFNQKIMDGEMANSTKAIKNEMKKIEKLHNLKDEEREVVKIGIISSYVKFLRDTDDIHKNIKRYGTT